ncbi:MAG: hypothetical protein H6850_01120 [Alphaproteobacteria bacterium]|nr:MAG: hypothetical protein H6850_01120 [Alphaproteobacteria bacterium]
MFLFFSLHAQPIQYFIDRTKYDDAARNATNEMCQLVEEARETCQRNKTQLPRFFLRNTKGHSVSREILFTSSGGFISAIFNAHAKIIASLYFIVFYNIFPRSRSYIEDTERFLGGLKLSQLSGIVSPVQMSIIYHLHMQGLNPCCDAHNIKDALIEMQTHPMVAGKYASLAQDTDGAEFYVMDLSDKANTPEGLAADNAHLQKMANIFAKRPGLKIIFQCCTHPEYGKYICHTERSALEKMIPLVALTPSQEKQRHPLKAAGNVSEFSDSE